MTVSWSSVSTPKKKPRAASSSRQRQGKALAGESRRSARAGRDESGKLIPIDLKVGDRVLFGKCVGHRGQARRRGAPDHEGIRLMGVLV